MKKKLYMLEGREQGEEDELVAPTAWWLSPVRTLGWGWYCWLWAEQTPNSTAATTTANK